jgi:cell division protein FtsI/penicillin-binding protein 2
MKRQHVVRSTRSQHVKMPGNAINVKMLAVLLAFVVLAGVLIFLFFDLQITRHDELAAKAASQQYMTDRESSKRGIIKSSIIAVAG